MGPGTFEQYCLSIKLKRGSPSMFTSAVQLLITDHSIISFLKCITMNSFTLVFVI